MSAPPKTREMAYTVWRQCGHNLSEAVRVLDREHGYSISRQSLIEWKKKYDWEGRAARAEAEQQQQAEATSDTAIMAVLLKQKQKYEDYLESLPIGKVDHQAIYAFNNLLKTIVDIRSRGENPADIDRPKLFMEDLEFVAKTLEEIDPEALKAFARNFDTVIDRFKEQHAQAA